MPATALRAFVAALALVLAAGCGDSSDDAAATISNFCITTINGTPVPSFCPTGTPTPDVVAVPEGTCFGGSLTPTVCITPLPTLTLRPGYKPAQGTISCFTVGRIPGDACTTPTPTPDAG